MTKQAKSSNIALSDYMMTHLEQDLARTDGVGEGDVFGAQYAMRLWLNPHKLRQYGPMPSDIRAAVEAQNTQGPQGQLASYPACQINI